MRVFTFFKKYGAALLMIIGAALFAIATSLMLKISALIPMAASVAQYQAKTAALAPYENAMGIGCAIFLIGATWLFFKCVFFILRRKY